MDEREAAEASLEASSGLVEEEAKSRFTPLRIISAHRFNRRMSLSSPEGGGREEDDDDELAD